MSEIAVLLDESLVLVALEESLEVCCIIISSAMTSLPSEALPSEDWVLSSGGGGGAAVVDVVAVVVESVVVDSVLLWSSFIRARMLDVSVEPTLDTDIRFS
ncbi:MAG: hypothetical protein HXX10_27370 [Rhodoplanes sp.]|nr:hypothetical protein [Rhodoplanes sp.]